MKHAGLFIMALLVVLPGCFDWMKKGEKKSVKTVKITKEQRKKKNAQHSLFLDDEVDELVFEEEGKNVFSAGFIKDDTAMRVVAEEDETDAYSQRRSDQIEYGFNTLYFNFDQYTVRNDQKTALQENARAAKKAVKKGKSVVIEGHSCHSAGSKTYNMLLSEKRAQAVAAYFVENGVAAENIKVVGRGCEMPIVQHGNRKQQAPNRRVELYTLAAQEMNS